MQNEIWYNEVLFQKLIENLPMGLALLNDKGELIICNHFFADEVVHIQKQVGHICAHEIMLMKNLKKPYVKIEFDANFEIEKIAHAVTLYPLKEGEMYMAIVEDISKERIRNQELLDMNYELNEKNKEILETQLRLFNQEKLVGIGQLAAGVAHEINNPLGFVKSNFSILNEYFNQLESIITRTQEYIRKMNDVVDVSDSLKRYEALLNEFDFNYILEEYKDLYDDTMIGLNRVEKIVTSLRKFSRIDFNASYHEYDINEGIEETLLIANNELKYDAEIIKDMQYVSLTLALGSEINQVLLNILINAVHAIKEKENLIKGIIKITTRSDEKNIYCEIMDNGVGIKEEYQDKIFMPFFTTKEVGKGTGLGMSIAYDIIVNKHDGDISFESKEGQGSTFRIKLPIKHVSTHVMDDFIEHY